MVLLFISIIIIVIIVVVIDGEYLSTTSTLCFHKDMTQSGYF